MSADLPVQAAPRYKVRFPDTESLVASSAAESPLLVVPVRNERRRFISVGAPEGIVGVRPGAAESLLDNQLTQLATEYGAEIVPDVQYDLEADATNFDLPVAPELPESASLDDVLDQIGARNAWGESQGDGVIVAVVDTGVNGARPEFPAAKRRGQWAPAGDDPWTDPVGHGTMCACIATGTRSAGGEFDGVAPGAGLISCRTAFYDSEVVTLYDYLTDFATDHPGVGLVASNSFGIKTGSPPPLPLDTDLADALGDAVAAGIVVCFSAGNYHDLAGGAPDACDPTSIWLHKCRADVVTVATCRMDGTMWHYSSRGPGQTFGEPGTAAKPDVTAPTPPNGRVVYGNGVMSLPEGWGTSGACPQVAGLAALLLGKRHAPPSEVADAIRATAQPLGHAETCEGRGRIDCHAAVTGF